MKSKFIIWKSESFKSIKTKDMKAIEFNKASIK